MTQPALPAGTTAFRLDDNEQLTEIFGWAKDLVARVLSFEWDAPDLVVAFGHTDLNTFEDCEVPEPQRENGQRHGSAMTLINFGPDSAYHDKSVMQFILCFDTKYTVEHQCHHGDTCMRRKVLHELCHVVTNYKAYHGRRELYVAEHNDYGGARAPEEEAIDMLVDFFMSYQPTAGKE